MVSKNLKKGEEVIFIKTFPNMYGLQTGDILIVKRIREHNIDAQLKKPAVRREYKKSRIYSYISIGDFVKNTVKDRLNIKQLLSLQACQEYHDKKRESYSTKACNFQRKISNAASNSINGSSIPRHADR